MHAPCAHNCASAAGLGAGARRLGRRASPAVAQNAGSGCARDPLYDGGGYGEYCTPGETHQSAPARRDGVLPAVGREDNHETDYSARGMCRGVFARCHACVRAIRRRREGSRRLQLRGCRKRGPRHEGFPFRRWPSDFRHRHAHGRQRLLRSGLCRRDGRRQPDRRQDPAARLGIADRRSGPRDRDPEPDRAGPDHRRPDHDDAAGRRL